jgi:hypothetical protein
MEAVLQAEKPVPYTNLTGLNFLSPTQPYENYPIPIPPLKLKRAVRLYIRYKLEEGLAQQCQEHGPTHNDNRLSPGGVPSFTSPSSRLHTPFTDEDGTSEVKIIINSELIYDSRMFKKHTRTPLPPIARARAALIRCLGSCSSCRSRRVAVSILASSSHV